MPTRKQRRRAQKERRHEYETVWVDPEGNELEEPPEGVAALPRKSDGAKRDGAKPKSQGRGAQRRGDRPIRVPPPPSWQRSTKRAVMFGVVIFAVFSLLGSKNGHHSYGSALFLGGVYTVIFIPFQYTIDRFAHNRWQRRAEQQGQKAAPRRR
jgi:hypothetical protein